MTYVPGWQFSFPEPLDETPHARGPRSEPPAVCYICGEDVPPGQRFGFEACCDKRECREATVRR
jgi:hypothetical protein